MGNCCLSSEGLKYYHPKSNSFIDLEFKSINSSSGFPSNINDPMIIIDQITLNPLGLALYYGQLSTFRLLIEEKGASPSFMESLFEKQGLSSIEVAIQRQCTSVIEYYFPLFFITSINTLESVEVYKKPLIHVAIEKENLTLIQYFYKFFYDVTPPNSFDFHYIDPNTEENSALVASRVKNLEIIRFLNEIVQVDFTILNAKKLNALHIASFNEKRKLKPKDKEVFKYLIEKCKVNVEYEHEILLFNIDENEITSYIEEELSKRRIFTTREEVMGKSYTVKKSQAVDEGDWNPDSGIIITTISDISSVENDCLIESSVIDFNDETSRI